MSASCIFCKIINQEIPATVIAKNEHVVVIQDRAPQAPIHYLILPLKHIENLHTLSEHDILIPGHIALMAQEIAKTLPGSSDFRIIINNGLQAGQTVFHLHAHFLSGKEMVGF